MVATPPYESVDALTAVSGETVPAIPPTPHALHA